MEVKKDRISTLCQKSNMFGWIFRKNKITCRLLHLSNCDDLHSPRFAPTHRSSWHSLKKSVLCHLGLKAQSRQKTISYTLLLTCHMRHRRPCTQFADTDELRHCASRNTRRRVTVVLDTALSQGHRDVYHGGLGSSAAFLVNGRSPR